VIGAPRGCLKIPASIDYPMSKMAAWTDEQIIDQARKWRWRPADTKVVSYPLFDLVVYPESWNENFVETKSLPHQTPGRLVQAVLAAASQLRLAKLAWRVPSFANAHELERALEEAGFVAEQMDELLAWELGAGPAPVLPERLASRDVIAEAVTTFEHYQAARRIDAMAFGHRIPSDQELERDWSSRAGESPEATKFDRFFARIGNVPISTGGLTMSDNVVRLWGAGTHPAHRGRGGYKAVTMARMNEGHHRGGTIAIVNARVGTSGPILKRMGFRLVALTKEYEFGPLSGRQ
jgi:hypothetical protein